MNIAEELKRADGISQVVRLLALEYNRRTERYDRLRCSVVEQGIAKPVTSAESSDCQVMARRIMTDMYIECVESLGFNMSDWSHFCKSATREFESMIKRGGVDLTAEHFPILDCLEHAKARKKIAKGKLVW